MGSRQKSPEAFRTISEVADDLALPQHVLRFWETRFSQIRPMKRGGGRRYYRPEDVDLLRGIRHLLYEDGYTIKGVQRILRQHGPRRVAEAWRPPREAVHAAGAHADMTHAGFADGSEEAGEYAPEVEPEAPPPAEAPDQSADTAAAPAALPDGVISELRSVLTELRDCRRILADAVAGSGRGHKASGD